MTDVRENDAPSAPRSAGRRAWVLGACAGAAALAFATAGRFGVPSRTFGISPAFADAPAGGGLDAFLSLSQRLSGRSSFDPVLGRRVYEALSPRSTPGCRRTAACPPIP